MNYQSVIEPILIGIINFLSDALQIGYDQLGDAEKEAILKAAPVLYTALATFGEEVAASTATPLDDQAIMEVQEALEMIAAGASQEAYIDKLKQVFAGAYVPPKP